VFQHTSPTRSGDGPMQAAPTLTRETVTRFTARRHAVFGLSEIAGTLAPWVPGPRFEPTSSGSEPRVNDERPWKFGSVLGPVRP